MLNESCYISGVEEGLNKTEVEILLLLARTSSRGKVPLFHFQMSQSIAFELCSLPSSNATIGDCAVGQFRDVLPVGTSDSDIRRAIRRLEMHTLIEVSDGGRMAILSSDGLKCIFKLFPDEFSPDVKMFGRVTV